MAGIEGISGIAAPAAGSAPAQAGGRADAAGQAIVVPRTAAKSAPAKEEREVQQSAGRVQQMLATAAPNLTFSVDRDSGRTVIKVIDPATHEVLRQIPAEEILRMSKNLDEMIARLKGLLVDRKI